MNNWEKIAAYVENVFGAQVDWEERYFVCPECVEPIYEGDWYNGEFKHHDSYICPVCENVFFYEGGDY